MNLSPENYKRILRFQQDEITGSILYETIAKRQKNEKNKTVLLEMARTEKNHYEIWKLYTGKDVSPDWVKAGVFHLISCIFGCTFAIKLMERYVVHVPEHLQSLEKEIPVVQAIIDDEEEYEKILVEMIDEEHLNYIGAMVLGLNDALVELTGTLAGLSFALADTRLVALSGIITGISATLSMAASNYLAERAEGNARALKCSFYTGAAYLITVILLVFPYLLLSPDQYSLAFGIMLGLVILIILLFNFYTSVAMSHPFMRNFTEMAGLSLGVALISFVIGLLAKRLLGIDI